MLIFNREVSLKGRGQKHSFPDFLVHRGEARFATPEGKNAFSAFWSAAAKLATPLRRENNLEANPRVRSNEARFAAT